MRVHSGAAPHAGLQRCDAASPSKLSVTFPRVMVSLYSGSNLELLDFEDEGSTILQAVTAHLANNNSITPMKTYVFVFEVRGIVRNEMSSNLQDILGI
jgi:hypothetical protein